MLFAAAEAGMTGTELAMIITASGGVFVGTLTTVFSGIAAIYAMKAKFISENNASQLQHVAQTTTETKGEVVKGQIVNQMAVGAAAAAGAIQSKQDAAVIQSIAIKQDEAAVKAQEVKTTLDNKVAKTDANLVDLKTLAASTHILVNSHMKNQLQVNAALAARLAALTGLPTDKEAKETADKLLAEHEEMQNAADDAVARTAADDAVKRSTPP